MDRFLRLASIVLIAVGAAACGDDDSSAPEGETSTVNVSVYVEDGDSDDPIAGATVTLDPVVEGRENLVGTTDASGVATFTEVPAGVYTLTHSPATPITNATLTGPTDQTLVAQFEGGTTNAAFVYSYNPGTISGRFFRDENDNDTYEADEDTTLAGFQAILFAGTDTVGSPVESITVEDDGAFVFDGLAQGDYTILVRPIVGATVVDTTVSVVVAAGETSNVLIEFEGGDAIATIAQARALPLGSTVTVEGVITAGTGVFSGTTAYFQDETAGIVLFTGSSPFSSLDLAVGDSIRVTGVTSAFNQELQIGGGAALEVEVLGRVAPRAPETVTVQDILDNEFQGELVTVNALTIDSVPATATGGNYNIKVHDATGTMIVFIDTDTGIHSSIFSVGQVWNITGLGTSFNALREVKPRSPLDIVLTSAPGGTISIATARALPNAQVVTVTGVVTAGPAPDTVFQSNSFYVQDNTGGVLVFCGGTGGTSCTSIGAGDSVTVTGTTATFSGEEQITGSATQTLTITEHAAGTLPTPIDIDASDVNAGRFQGRLATTDSVQVVSVSGTGGNVTLQVSDANGTFQVFLDTDTGLTGSMFTVGSSYSLTGILAAFTPSGQPTQYQLKPRGAADVTAL
ncbi:MAG TPA: hypothetical protein VF039_11330 [Longimicrobiales bacterium]